MSLQHGSKIDQIYFAPLLPGQIMLHCNKNCNVPVSPHVVTGKCFAPGIFSFITSSTREKILCYDFFFLMHTEVESEKRQTW